MPFIIETWDKPGSQALRQSTRSDHLDFLDANAARLLACGAKLHDDGSDAGGGLYIVDVGSRDEAQAFIDSDPFTQAGLFERISITNWRKAFLDRTCYIPGR
jgi:uncharacterized protein YciI